jgi:hypothetical protein
MKITEQSLEQVPCNPGPYFSKMLINIILPFPSIGVPNYGIPKGNPTKFCSTILSFPVVLHAHSAATFLISVHFAILIDLHTLSSSLCRPRHRVQGSACTVFNKSYPLSYNLQTIPLPAGS